jgi:O-antigen/teichoic acid export membrane protein
VRRYGNRPGLAMAAFIVAATVLVLPSTVGGWAVLLAVVVAPVAGLMLWHWRDYRRELREFRARREFRRRALDLT